MHIKMKSSYKNHALKLEYTSPQQQMFAGFEHPFEKELVQAWIILHEEDLMTNWEFATTERNIFKIEPLK